MRIAKRSVADLGTYGTYTGILRWYDATNEAGHLLVLKDGELQTDITGDYWASGATGYDEGSGFWLDRQFTPGTTIAVGEPMGLLLALTYAEEVSSPATGVTRLFFGNSAGNKVTWDGTDLVIVGNVTATSGAFGGWTVNDTYLAKDTGTDATSAGMAPLDYPFYSGATYANRATAPWRVTPTGKMYILGSMYLSQVGGYSLVVGSNWSTEPTGNYGVFIGNQTGDGFTDNSTVAIGHAAATNSSGNSSVFIGHEAGNAATSAYTIAIGHKAGQFATKGDNIFVGYNAGYNSNGRYGVGIGANALNQNTVDYVVGIGYGAASGNTSAPVIAIGPNAGVNNTYEKVVLIGSQVVATANQQIVFGSQDVEYFDLYGGGGVEQTSVGKAPHFRINATGGSGTDAYGGDLRLAGGAATGNAASGIVAIQTASPGASGSTKQTLTDRVWVNADGSMDFTQFLQLAEISDPSAPATNYARLYVKDNGSGKTQLCVRFPTGAVQVLATEP